MGVFDHHYFCFAIILSKAVFTWKQPAQSGFLREVHFARCAPCSVAPVPGALRLRPQPLAVCNYSLCTSQDAVHPATSAEAGKMKGSHAVARDRHIHAISALWAGLAFMSFIQGLCLVTSARMDADTSEGSVSADFWVQTQGHPRERDE